ncbi:hypothetical protein [Candidatus Entotheonella palauensis]|uniref:hypothetical protein n=1 Tax=Candidatus Entotheonella palauensis TaxID=93172 RepID=UPI000B7F5CEE|nr:hypothetical protein [Candidatus Entotheonella palauensis]
MSEDRGYTTSWNDVKLFFRGIDIGIMRGQSGDITGSAVTSLDYHGIRNRKTRIVQLIESPHDFEVMPKPPFARWDRQKIETFKKWLAPETPLVIDPVRQREAQAFINVSQFLTGFEDLHEDPELAHKHLMRLRNQAAQEPQGKGENDFSNDDLDTVINRFDPDNTRSFKTDILCQERYAKVAQVIIVLWYTGAFMENGFAVDSGTANDNQYIQGLIWRATQSHPAGYSPEGADHSNPDPATTFHYWKHQPQASGQYTGLGIQPDSPAHGM